ncbi:MAG: CcdB family protein [Labilithrix sp.]|nr:CcdB family protein [Labilithrix sp.]MCW5811321.1 CcdB family protein [Labilithrix sp.]
MAQFDVHRNPGKQAAVPYVVVVQSKIFDTYRRRVVVPLVKRAVFGAPLSARLNPAFTVRKDVVVLHPLDIVSVPREALGKPISSLEQHGSSILDALDTLLTRAYG